MTQEQPYRSEQREKKKMNTYTQTALISCLHLEMKENHFRKAKGKYENLPDCPSYIFLPSNSDLSRNHSSGLIILGYHSNLSFCLQRCPGNSQFLHKASPGYIKRGHTDISSGRLSEHTVSLV